MDALKLAIGILINIVIIGFVMKIISHFGINFVGFFQGFWEKTKNKNRNYS